MSDDGLGWGILATGWIAQVFTKDLQDAGLRVTAVGSRTAERAEAFAAEHGIPHAHGSLGRSSPRIPTVDVIYVATTHPAHAEAAKVALEHGKHVLVEKPFTLNAARGRGARRARRGAGPRAARGDVDALPAAHGRDPRRDRARATIGEPQVLIAEHIQALPADPSHRHERPGARRRRAARPRHLPDLLRGRPVRAADGGGRDGDVHADGRRPARAGHAHARGRRDARCSSPRRTSAAATAPRSSAPAARSRSSTPGTRPPATRCWTRSARSSARPIRRSTGRGMQYQALELEELVRSGRTSSERMPAQQSVGIMRVLDAVRERIGLVYPQERRAG